MLGDGRGEIGEAAGTLSGLLAEKTAPLVCKEVTRTIKAEVGAAASE